MNSIQVQNLSKSFEGFDNTKNALLDVSLTINEGECVVISGENGSGKTVLTSIIAGLEKADSGSVSTFGRVGLVFQEAETQILGETVLEDVEFGPKNLGFSPDQLKQSVEDALAFTGLLDKKDEATHFLSGGQKRRLAIACMLAMQTPVIILDEPYANLDYSGVKQVNSLIESLKAHNKTVIIVSHELEKCLGLSDHFIVLFRGRKVFDGTPAEGLEQNLSLWNIRNPLARYDKLNDLIWK